MTAASLTGGVAIIFKANAMSMSRVQHPNPGDFEVVAGVGTLPGHSRRLVVVACYLSLIHI